MLFNSFIFIIFFISVVSIYYLSTHKYRWLILLIASLIFYGSWSPLLLLLLLLSVSINYIASAKIYLSDSAKKRKKYLVFGQLFNFGLLFVFKYFMFFFSEASGILAGFGADISPLPFEIILPMGISFYTFQAAGYMFDIYRKRINMENNFLKFLLFITFFPQLVAGPIERASNLLPQLFTEKKFSSDNFTTGLKYMAFGFFKKIVIADRISVAVNTVYNSPKDFGGLTFIISTVFFAFQIYCDFSGYSDIAVGCSKILGIDLMQNFTQPYLSSGFREFWRRWHISLSGWFKDYLYIPMGGSRVSKPRHYLNTMVTFLVSGLWHGANLTFVLWGAIHGLYQIIETAFASLFNNPQRDKKDIIPLRLVKTAGTFMLVCFAWIFFRANSIEDAFFIAGHLFTNAHINTGSVRIFDILNNFGMPLLEIIISFALIIFLSVTDLLGGNENIHIYLSNRSSVVRFIFYFVITAAILSLGVFHNAGEFIYFQF